MLPSWVGQQQYVIPMHSIRMKFIFEMNGYYTHTDPSTNNMKNHTTYSRDACVWRCFMRANPLAKA